MADDQNQPNNKQKKLKRELKRKIDQNESEVEALVESLRNFIARNVRKILDGLRGGDITAREAAKQLGGLEVAIQEAGLGERLTQIKGLFSNEFEAVKDEFTATADKVAPLSAFVRANLDAIADDRLRAASKMVELHLGDIRSVVMDTVIAGKTIQPEKILEDAGDRVYRNIKTEINTTLMAYNRIAHLEKAKKVGITKFLYVGPDDDITRPFCKEHVGGVYSLEEMAKMDNGQGLPVEVYCGGYQCRHHWRPISDGFAAELQGSRE